MKCPNCGRNIRSKKQCAYCGYDFELGAVDPTLRVGKINTPSPSPDQLENYSDPYIPGEDSHEEAHWQTLPPYGSSEVTSSAAHSADDYDQPAASSEDDWSQTYGEEYSDPYYPEGAAHSANEASDDYYGDDDYYAEDEYYEDDYYDDDYYDDDYYDNDYDDDDYDYVPATPRSRGGVFSFIWGLIKLVLAVGLVFLAFSIGPDLYSQLSERLGFGSGSNQEQVESSQAPTEESSSVQAPAAVSQESSADEQAADEDSSAAYKPVSSNIDVDHFPMVNMQLNYDQSLDDLDLSDVKLSIEHDGSEEALDNFTISKEGQSLLISYNDPSVSLISDEPSEQQVHVRTADGSLNETVTYQLPNLTIDKAKYDQFNDIITNNLASTGNVSVVLKEEGDAIPYVYEDKTLEADVMLSWFVLQRIYQAIADNELTFETPVTMSDALKAVNDSSATAQAEEGSSLTVQELITAVIHNQDASALAHLIQATGGASDFNLWLKENNYFATKLSDRLSVSSTGQITGAVTNASDVARLLMKLAENELIDADMDPLLKEALLQTPISAKYPAEGISSVVRRYEITSSDDNQGTQHYSSIIVTEDTYYILVSLVDTFQDAGQVVTGTSQAVAELISYFQAGTDPSELTRQEAEEASSSESVSQVEVVEESTAPSQPAQPAAGQTNPHVSSGGYQYSGEVDANGEYTQVYDPNMGVYRPIQWMTNAEGKRVFYYSDGGPQ